MVSASSTYFQPETLVTSAILLINRHAVKITPTSMAVIKSIKIPVINVARKITASVFGALKINEIIAGTLLILYATKIKIAASVGIGIKPARGIITSKIINTTILCTTPTTGVFPPFFTDTLLRATAPATGTAPKRPQKILAIP